MAASTAGLLSTTTATVAIPQLALDESTGGTPVASLEPTGSIKDGIAQLTIALSEPADASVTVRAVVNGAGQDVVVPAGQRRTAIAVPLQQTTNRLAVMLTSYDVTTVNGVAILDR